MTEQEIINFLKENKGKGMAYLFFPHEVWDWIDEHLNDPELHYLSSKGEWKQVYKSEFDESYDERYDNVVFCLPDDYKKATGEWVELKIDEKGFFNVNDDTGDSNDDDEDNDNFLWHQWNNFLDLSYRANWGYTAFGGWQYGGSPCWYTSPQLRFFEPGELDGTDNMNNNNSEAKPAIPIKIRFWREK